MRVIKTAVWVLVAVIVTGFTMLNWGEPVAVNFWIGESGSRLGFQWPVAFVALFFFALGLLPMWLLAKAGKWRLTRRINALESSVRNAISPAAVPPIATSTQLDAESDRTQP